MLRFFKSNSKVLFKQLTIITIITIITTITTITTITIITIITISPSSLSSPLLPTKLVFEGVVQAAPSIVPTSLH